MKFCSNCGAPLDEDMKFCIQCGQKVLQEAPLTPPEPVKKRCVSLKKIPMILLLIVPYAVLIVCYRLNLDMMIGIGLYGALLLFNMIYAFWMPKLGFNGKQILFWNLLLKLCNIPLINLIRVSALVMLLIGGKQMQEQSVSMVLIALLVLFLVRLSSTVFGISGFRCCRKHGTLSKAGVVISSIIQFIPCIDVIGTIICYVMFRKEGQSAA